MHLVIFANWSKSTVILGISVGGLRCQYRTLIEMKCSLNYISPIYEWKGCARVLDWRFSNYTVVHTPQASSWSMGKSNQGPVSRRDSKGTESGTVQILPQWLNGWRHTGCATRKYQHCHNHNTYQNWPGQKHDQKPWCKKNISRKKARKQRSKRSP